MFDTVSVNLPTKWTPIKHVIVVIPAHNEAKRIDRAITAVHAAATEVAEQVTVSIVVVADACTDQTAAIATRSLAKLSGAVTTTLRRQAGAARLAGVAAGLALASIPLNRVWLASTDADSVVPATWLQRQLDAGAAGYGGIAGVVELVHDADFDEDLGREFTAYYQTNLDGTHDHVHGANMGFRAEAYQAVGGWRCLATGEDHDLWRRLGVAGWSLRSDASLVVGTSARRGGRAPEGFAWDLVALERSAKVA